MNERTRWIVTTGALAAIEIVLYIVGVVISKVLPIIPISLNLSLVPIAVGAIILGPWCGMFLGFINGLCAILTPDTMAFFMPMSAGGTILTCLLKTMAAGFLSGLLFKLFKGKKFEIFGMILCSLIIPIINTSIFAACCFIFFRSWIFSSATENEMSPMSFFIFGVVGWNFVFEVTVSAVFSPAICKIVHIARRKQDATA